MLYTHTRYACGTGYHTICLVTTRCYTLGTMHCILSLLFVYAILVVLSRPSFMHPSPARPSSYACSGVTYVHIMEPYCTSTRLNPQHLRQGGCAAVYDVLTRYWYIYTRYHPIVSYRQFHNMSYPCFLNNYCILWLSYHIQWFVYYVQFRPIFTEFLCKKFFILLNIFYAPQYIVVLSYISPCFNPFWYYILCLMGALQIFASVLSYVQ